MSMFRCCIIIFFLIQYTVDLQLNYHFDQYKIELENGSSKYVWILLIFKKLRVDIYIFLLF